MLKTVFEKIRAFLSGVHPEVFFWVGGFLFLLVIKPGEEHFSLCLFKNLGIDFCPGCGLGRSISFFLHFNLTESFKTHPLGIPAFLIIMHRVISLLRNNTMPSRISAAMKLQATAKPAACEKE